MDNPQSVSQNNLYVPLAPTGSAACPCCGYCPHCKRQYAPWMIPMPYVSPYPYQTGYWPQWTYTT